MMNNMMKALLSVILMLLFPMTGYPEDHSPANGTTKADLYKNLEKELGTAPDGFSWNFCRNAISLKPDGWFVHDVTQNLHGPVQTTHAMSPVDFSASKPFETGFTVGIFTNLKKYGQPEPSKSASILIGMVLNSHAREDILHLRRDKKGEFDLFWIRYRDAPPGQTPIIVHQFYVADDVTDNLNFFIFESPEDKWDENWKKYGEVILKRVSVIPGYPND